jgi:nucleotide-binding universal stress UspA family protein
MAAMSDGIDRILVGIDGSAHGRRPLPWAMRLAARFDAEVIVVHAVGLLDHLEPEHRPSRHHHLAQIRRDFEAWCAPLVGSGIRHRRLLVDGSSVPVLLEAAGREKADVIVVGRRGAGGGELLLGSTSHQLAEQAGCPVVILPPANTPR